MQNIVLEDAMEEFVKEIQDNIQNKSAEKQLSKIRKIISYVINAPSTEVSNIKCSDDEKHKGW